MKTEKIEVSIKGRAGSGKTTIMRIINDALKSEGFDIDLKPGIDFDNDESRFMMITSINSSKKINAIKNKETKIIIQEVQANREWLLNNDIIESEIK